MAELHQGMPWPGWKNPRPWLRPASCFALAIVWTENKNVTIFDRFIWFILTAKQSAALAACVLRATTKKGRQLFLGKRVHPRENPVYAPDYNPLIVIFIHQVSHIEETAQTDIYIRWRKYNEKHTHNNPEVVRRLLITSILQQLLYSKISVQHHVTVTELNSHVYRDWESSFMALTTKLMKSLFSYFLM